MVGDKIDWAMKMYVEEDVGSKDEAGSFSCTKSIVCRDIFFSFILSWKKGEEKVHVCCELLEHHTWLFYDTLKCVSSPCFIYRGKPDIWKPSGTHENISLCEVVQSVVYQVLEKKTVF